MLPGKQDLAKQGMYLGASNDGFAPVCGKDDDGSDGGFQGPVQVREAFYVQHVNLVNNNIIVLLNDVFQGPDLGNGACSIQSPHVNAECDADPPAFNVDLESHYTKKCRS